MLFLHNSTTFHLFTSNSLTWTIKKCNRFGNFLDFNGPNAVEFRLCIIKGNHDGLSKGRTTLNQIILQIIILIAVLFILRLFRGLIPKRKRPKLHPIDCLPLLSLGFIWQLSHAWADPWFAAIVFIWMIISIGLTLWWGLSKGELLWNKFLLFYWRLTDILLFFAYLITIIIVLLK